MAEEKEQKVDVVIGFDFENPKRQGTTESIPASEAHELVRTGRAQYKNPPEAEGEKGSKKNSGPTTLGAS